jgi:integrase/recombinase XerD
VPSPLIDQWAQFLAATGSSNNTVAIRVKAMRALQHHAGVADPLSINRLHVINFLGRDIRPWTRFTYWISIHQWCKFLRDFDLQSNPDLLRGIPRPKKPTPVARPINDDVIGNLLRLKASPRAHAYIRLALYAGLRVHEIAKIRAEDFDFANGWLMVTGKGGFTAPVPLHPELRKLAERMPETGYWFPSAANPFEHVHPTAVSKTIRAALQQVGSTATAHQLRDTCATQIQRQGRDIRVTQTFLRHQNVTSTQKYTGVADASMHAAVLSLDWGTAA